MKTKYILTTQKEVVKNWKGDFQAQACDEGIRYVYEGDITSQTYCEFLGMDYPTVSLLGAVSYGIEYNCIEGNKYILKCETYINSIVNENLSFELEDNEDYLGFYGETKEEEQKIGVAQWLPSNWKELITDEQKEEIAKEWCEENSDELGDFLSDSDKADIAYDYIDNNSNDIIDRAYNNLGDYEKREFIKDCIDNL